MEGDAPISWLMFFTFAAAIFAIAGASAYFLRRRMNREIAADALTGSDAASGPAPDGALPELLAVTLFACIAMGLLTIGFKSKPYSEQKQNPPPVGVAMPKT